MRVFVLAFLCVLGYTAIPQTSDLTIVVEGVTLIENSNIMIAVYNNKDAFLDSEQIYKKVEVPVDTTRISYTFTELPPGFYAISLYHDEDNDNEMDRKWYGPPKEGYGFSNNFTSNVRPARFNDAMVDLSIDKTIFIKVVY